MMFSTLDLTNFRAFDEKHIELAPITLFVGPNNGGKSAILSALLMLSQTLKSLGEDVQLLLNGEYAELGTYRDLAFRNDVNRQISIGLVLDSFPDANGDDVEPILVGHFPIRFSASFRFRPGLRRVVASSVSLSDTLSGQPRVLLEMQLREKGTYPQLAKMLKSLHGTDTFGPRVRCPLVNFMPYPARSFYEHPRKFRTQYDSFSYVQHVSSAVFSALRDLSFVGPLRQPPARTYLFSGAQPSTVGAMGENVVDLLVADQQSRSKERKALVRRISEWMEQAGIGSDLALPRLSERHFEVRLKHPVSGEVQNLADVGFGCSQVLPVLVAAYSASEGSTLILQQPEIHLHPRAQAELGSLICDVHRNKAQVLVETHSEHLILRLQRLVAEKKLDANAIKIYYVYREGRAREVTYVPLENSGLFAQEWPQGFFPERMDEALKIHAALAKAGTEGPA